MIILFYLVLLIVEWSAWSASASIPTVSRCAELTWVSALSPNVEPSYLEIPSFPGSPPRPILTVVVIRCLWEAS